MRGLARCMLTMRFDSSTPRLNACLDYQFEEDYCPNCGALGYLSEVTGWCNDCTKEHNHSNNLCIECSTPVPFSHGRNLCWDCKQERWLTQYANIIEMVMLTGPSFSAAVVMVKEIVRPICVVCGGPIRGGTPGESMFCSSKPRCVKARQKYRRLLNKGIDSLVAVDLSVRG